MLNSKGLFCLIGRGRAGDRLRRQHCVARPVRGCSNCVGPSSLTMRPSVAWQIPRPFRARDGPRDNSAIAHIARYLRLKSGSHHLCQHTIAASPRARTMRAFNVVVAVLGAQALMKVPVLAKEQRGLKMRNASWLQPVHWSVPHASSCSCRSGDGACRALPVSCWSASGQRSARCRPVSPAPRPSVDCQTSDGN